MGKSEERVLERQEKRYIMALDAGTTSNRCILFDKSGTIVSMAQKEFRKPPRYMVGDIVYSHGWWGAYRSIDC